MIATMLISILACSAPEKKSKVDEPLVEDKYRLLEDRQALEEMRKQVPPEKKVQNDELALIMAGMGDTNRNPSDVRNKFNSILNRKRQLFQNDMTRRREIYVKQERKDREMFTKELEKKRNTFVRGRPSADEKKDFFNDLDTQRRDFYSDQREKREEFESDIRDQRKNFEDYIREKTNEFNQAHREYTKRWEDEKRKKNNPDLETQ